MLLEGVLSYVKPTRFIITGPCLNQIQYLRIDIDLGYLKNVTLKSLKTALKWVTLKIIPRLLVQSFWFRSVRFCTARVREPSSAWVWSWAVTRHL